jgi:transcriptional antiterminator RfaH
MAKHWHALRSHPNKELLLWQQVRANGIEVFYPCIRVQPVNPRSRKLRSYFPGYLFIQADLEEVGISLFQWMPYSSGLVTFGGDPAVVPDNLIHGIQEHLHRISEAGGELYANLKPGDLVVIQSGPFAGYEALFDLRLPGSERVRVLLKMLSDRNVPLELGANQIQKKRKPRQA